MKLSVVVATFTALAASLWTIPALSAEVRWVNAVSIPSGPSGFFNGKCDFIGCPVSKSVAGSVAVGQTIHGMKVGAIKCEKQSKTMRGFPGGPKFAAIAGTWNCKASVSKAAVTMSPSANGDRSYPWLIVVGARI